jgi:2,4-dienoyl-CoA reductase-like NADH-dependent reductase (Old Yellow Enzyme family)
MVRLCDTLHWFVTIFVVQCTAVMGRVGKFVDNIPVCASAVPHQWRPDITCRPLGIVEIEKIVEAFGQAAEILVAAGVDGMELHGHEGYIFDQFATPLWNKRTDQYGGSQACPVSGRSAPED